VDRRLEEIRQRMAKLVPVEGRDAGRPGDYATVDYVATVDGADFPGSEAKGVKVEIAPGELIHSRCAALEGVKVGETRTLDYAFPPDYQVEAVKGKTARFQLTVRELRAQVTPELNDDFAREIGGGQTLAEMREKVQGDLLAAERARVRQADREEVIAELLKRNPFEVPGAMVDRAVDAMLQLALRNMTRAGVDPRALPMNYDALRADLRDKATLEVKGTLALEAIGFKEGVEVTDADVEAKLQELARESGKTLEQLQAAMDDSSGKRQLYEKLREEKTIEFLKVRAKYS
jgi:trigger factor